MASDRLRMTNLCCLGGVQASYLKNTTDKTVQFAVDSYYGPSHHDGSDHSQRLNNKDYVTKRLSKPEKYLLFKVKELPVLKDHLVECLKGKTVFLKIS